MKTIELERYREGVRPLILCECAANYDWFIQVFDPDGLIQLRVKPKASIHMPSYLLTNSVFRSNNKF